VFSQLKSDWIVGWNNIITKDYVGESHGYTCGQTSVGTTNGAGPHNVQMFMLSPDGVVLHCMPGFWHPDDLARELKLGQRMLELWQRPGLSLAAKQTQFAAMQLGELASQPREMHARSRWQGFDAKNEQQRLEEVGFRDTIVLDAEGQPLMNAKGKLQMKTTNVVVHERMAQRPFVPFAAFDTAQFADYGRRYYDNNKKVDGEGAIFMTPRRVAKQEQREEKQAKRAARKAEQAARRAAKRAAKMASKEPRRLTAAGVGGWF